MFSQTVCISTTTIFIFLKTTNWIIQKVNSFLLKTKLNLLYHVCQTTEFSSRCLCSHPTKFSCVRMRVRKWLRWLLKILPSWPIVEYWTSYLDWRCFQCHRTTTLHLGPTRPNCSRTCGESSPPGCSRLILFHFHSKTRFYCFVYEFCWPALAIPTFFFSQFLRMVNDLGLIPPRVQCGFWPCFFGDRSD